MIDKEKIFEEAENVYDEHFLANSYGAIYFDNGDQEEAHTPDQVKEAFVRGAEWMRGEFVKKLWHDASEEPEKFKPCLVYGVFTYAGGEPIEDYCTSIYTTYGWAEDYFPTDYDFDIVRWCYIDDILPKEGGEE